MPTVLETEIETFEKNRERLVAAGEGKFALVHGDTIVGIYESKSDAISQGYQKFGNRPFLVKQILKVDIPQNFVTNLLGV